MDIKQELKKYNEETNRLRDEMHAISDRLYNIVKDDIYADDPDIDFLLWLDDNLTQGFISFEVSRRLNMLKKQGLL